jgi:2-polyprenyl-6-methoxyphenol hydroxylase-like FAD-dependent oxidoreductase
MDADTKTGRQPDVVIVGAGPTGLLLAGDLAERGVAVTLLERRAAESDNTTTRAFAVHARTLEQFDARGIADELLETGTTIGGLRLFNKVSVDFSRLPTRFPFLLVTPQYQVEHALTRRALEAGARIVRGVQATGVTQDAEGVSVRAEAVTMSGSGGGDGASEPPETEYRAAYVVGTDGVRSTVREQIGLPFPGRPVIKSIMLADVRFATPPEDTLTVNGVGEAFGFIAPFGDGWFRVFGWNRRHQVPDSAPLELDEVRGVLVRSFGTDFGLAEARWLSRFHSDERQAPAYRVGRVFLAGDAAHCHSPAGGMGMNTGLQDAANLGWKLAAVLHGRVDDAESLLNSYQAERHPVGHDVLRASGALVRLALIKPWIARFARDNVGSALARVPVVVHRLAGQVTGIGIAYGRPAGAHPLVGRRVGDVQLAIEGGNTAGRLYEALRAGRFVLLGRSAEDAALAEAGDWKDDVDYAVSVNAPAALVLVRPDGYAAWASDEPDAAVRAAAAREALEARYEIRRSRRSGTPVGAGTGAAA